MAPMASMAQLNPDVKTDSTGVAVPTAIKTTDIIQRVEDSNKESTVNFLLYHTVLYS